MSPPLTAKSPVTTVLALRIVVVPVVEPIVIAVPAPAKFTVVALALIKLNVEAVVVMSPPLTARSPSIAKLRPMLRFFSIPTPPSITNAPESLSVLSVVLLINTRGVDSKVTLSLPLVVTTVK